MNTVDYKSLVKSLLKTYNNSYQPINLFSNNEKLSIALMDNAICIINTNIPCSLEQRVLEVELEDLDALSGCVSVSFRQGDEYMQCVYESHKEMIKIKRDSGLESPFTEIASNSNDTTICNITGKIDPALAGKIRSGFYHLNGLCLSASGTLFVTDGKIMQYCTDFRDQLESKKLMNIQGIFRSFSYLNQCNKITEIKIVYSKNAINYPYLQVIYKCGTEVRMKLEKYSVPAIDSITGEPNHFSSTLKIDNKMMKLLKKYKSSKSVLKSYVFDEDQIIVKLEDQTKMQIPVEDQRLDYIIVNGDYIDKISSSMKKNDTLTVSYNQGEEKIYLKINDQDYNIILMAMRR